MFDPGEPLNEQQKTSDRRDEQLLRFARDFKTAYEQERHARSTLKRTYQQTVRALAMAVEARDKLTGGHIDRVASFAIIVGRHLKLDTDLLERLEIVAVLHDVGKLSVPDAVLNKPGPLDEDEWRVMRTHPAAGSALLEQIEFLAEASRAVRAHHERFDGTGYPRGIAGKAIPLEARIVAVADSFDAMINDRPYRRALPLDVVFQELRTCSGNQFDPAVVTAFCDAWDSGLLAATFARRQVGREI